ncbi:MAG: class I SAM-dependent methyltransferase [Geobacteraceae bacterium]|nr:class I SAM-dependent methyltransferase [Geobacteraceae bacterium]
MYDFSRCKLCAATAASRTYELAKTTVYACSACGFHYISHLDSLPAESTGNPAQTLNQKAWDYIESRLPGNGKQLKKNLDLVSHHLSLTGSYCLDIGAGAGLFPRLLADSGAFVHGIEPQGIFREFAQRKFGIDLNEETIESRHWQQGFTNFFDVVTLWDILEHVNFPSETLQNAYNVTKPGGWLFLDTPRRDALYYRISEWAYRLSGGKNALFLESLYSPLPFRHKQIFTLRQLVQLVKSIGYTVISLHNNVLQPQNKMVLVCQKL